MAKTLNEGDIYLKDQIAARLKEIRESTGKNQTEFAYEMGIDRQVVNRLEQGRGASVYSIHNYCKLAGISLKDFFDSPLF